MEVKIKKLTSAAVIPTYAKEGDAGMDLTCIETEWDETILVCKTGLAVEIPKGYVGLVFPRSSISKTCLMQSNSIGVIDSGYRGEIIVKFKVSGYGKLYAFGERVAQLIIVPFPTISFVEVDELSDSERGEGGFGSTNQK